ncbi:MAG: hypothetical protein IJV08_04850 [Bacteroidaceae bacterium]|nr:hypothetical protein [Bacteroidaceae bacterium]
MATTGKIFSDSSSIYQDQARLLFDFYEQAAERIVRQEEEIEKQIQNLEKDREQVEFNRSEILRKWWNLIALLIYWISGKKKIEQQIQAINQKIEEKKQEHANIFRDYKVTKMGVAYIPVAQQIAYEDKCFVVDYTGNVENSRISLQMSRQNDLLVETMSQMEKLTTEAPVVETSNEPEAIDTNEYSLSIQEVNQGDYVGKLDRSIRTISFCMNDTEVKSVDLPLVADNSEYLNFLNEYATSDAGYHPVVKVFDDKRFNKEIDTFCQLNKLKDSLSNDTEQFEDVLKHLMHTMAMSVQTISAMKLASTDKVINKSNDLLFKILKAPYNHYSPLLEAEEIRRIRNERFDYSDSIQGYEPFQLRESSRVRYNLFADEWTAEDNSSASVPFGVHQIYEEIVAPMVQHLMEENRIERIRIYGQIHDQKLSYLNKWHQDVDAFYRSNHAESADIINNMQKTLSEYVEAYNTLAQLQKTLDSMGEEGATLDSTIVEKQDGSADALAAFELQAQEYKKVQEEFSDYMERLQDDIALKAEKFGHVEFYDARLQDGYSNAMATAANEVNNLDERRKPLATTNPLLAKESVLLPQPDVEDVTYEHLSLNLPSLAVNALDSVSQIAVTEKQIKQEYTPSDSEDDKMPAILEEEDEVPPVPGEDEEPAIPEGEEDGMPPIPEEDEAPEIPENEIPEIPNQG